MAKFKNTFFHPAVFIPILLVFFIVSVALTKILIWPSIKKLQARDYKESANQFLENENYRNAFIEIRKAILKDPLDLESYRIALKAAEKSADHFQYVPGFLAKLMEIDPGNPDHFVKFILITLQLGELSEAQNAFDKFPNENRDTEEYHQLGYSIALEKKNDAETDHHLSELIRLRPDDLKLKFTLSTLRLRSSDDNTKGRSCKCSKKTRHSRYSKNTCFTSTTYSFITWRR